MIRGLINRLALNAGSPKPDIILHRSLDTMSPEEMALGEDCLLAVSFFDTNVDEEIDLLVSKLEGLNFTLIS